MPDSNGIVDATNPDTWTTTLSRTIEIDADTTKFERKIDDAERMGRRFSMNLLSAFEAVAFKGKSLNDVFKSLALSMSSMALTAAFAPMAAALTKNEAKIVEELLAVQGKPVEVGSRDVKIVT